MILRSHSWGNMPQLLLAALLTLCSGCASEQPVGQAFFNQGYDQMGSRFETYSLPDQIKIYLYGVQEIQPPVTVLSRQIASRGATAIPYITDLLAHQPTDQNVRDLIVVFETMQRIGAYNVKRDKALLKLLDHYVSNMTNTVLKGNAKDNMARIKNSEVSDESGN